MTNRLDGQIFGRLTVVRASTKRTPNGTILWLCKCDCGNKRFIATPDLKRGSEHKSCGCYKKEWAAEMQTTHGMFGTPEYRSYTAMMARCYNKNSGDYKRYGARGVRVCKRWKASFENFYADMGDRPKGKTLDRRDNDGHYTPNNCRWASGRTQANNKSNNVVITYRGNRRTLAQAVRDAGNVVDYYSAYQRIKYLGWKVRRALETPC